MNLFIFSTGLDSRDLNPKINSELSSKNHNIGLQACSRTSLMITMQKPNGKIAKKGIAIQVPLCHENIRIRSVRAKKQKFIMSHDCPALMKFHPQGAGPCEDRTTQAPR
jgi:hypothetical protein